MSASSQPQSDRGLFRRFLYNREVRSVITQIVVVMLVCALFYKIGSNVLTNLTAIGKDISFGFVGMPASYDITFQPFVDYDPSKSHFWAAMVGLSNTLLVAISGIILATILGFTLGVMRLSRNFLVSRISQVFIEFNRNVPVLLHILFLYGVIIHILPKPKQSISVFDTAFISNRWHVCTQTGPQRRELVLSSCPALVAIAAIFALSRWARKAPA
jgi:general L-amino acid transport system permease protein